MQPDTQSPRSGGAARWLDQWEPEDETFWESKGKSIAWNALTITTANLTMAFAVLLSAALLMLRRAPRPTAQLHTPASQPLTLPWFNSAFVSPSGCKL